MDIISIQEKSPSRAEIVILFYLWMYLHTAPKYICYHSNYLLRSACNCHKKVMEESLHPSGDLFSTSRDAGRPNMTRIQGLIGQNKVCLKFVCVCVGGAVHT